MSQLARRQPESLTPLSAFARLVPPYRVLDGLAPGQTIYYFLKVAAKQSAGLSPHSLPAEIARQVAMIVVNRRSGTFVLQWYPPHNETPQIIAALPFSALGQVTQDLCDAGFGARPPVSVVAADLRLTEPPSAT
jgi:hypothetical protein